MASKYLQKYQVPEGFYDILHEFTREVLRAQPDDILDYAANYFEHKSEGRDYYYESKHNVQKQPQQKSKAYNPTPHSNYSEQAKKVVEASNARAVAEATAAATSAANNRQNSGASQKPNRAPSAEQNGGRPLTSNSIKSEKPHDTSKISHQSKKSDISHPEEKKISKEFVDDLYSSAIHQAIGSTHHQDYEDQEEEEAEQVDQTPGEPEVNNPEQVAVTKPQQQQAEEVVLDGPVEEYENVALKIQSVFRGNKVRKGKKE